MAAAFIIGGCGTVSHSLQFIPRIDTFRCNDCSNVLLTTSGFYYCSDCYHKTCTDCATHLSLFYPTLTDAQVAAIAAQVEEDEKTLIPCGGSSTHKLKLLKQSPYDVFDKHFYCNVCWQEGDGELYHCDDCQFDAHRECAELPKWLKVFYHAHQLKRTSAHPDVSCDFCTKPVEEDFYMCQLCNFTVHPMCTKHPQKLMHVAHNHILTLVPTSQEKSIICDGCITPAPGFRYTCQPCDFDLHPGCAIVPPNPLCVVDGGHRLAIDWKQGNFQCARCQQPGFSWSYNCEVHEFHLHLHCANEPLVEEEEGDDEDVADVWNRLYQAALVEAVNEDYAAKVNLLSELLDVFMRTEVQTESSDNNQRSPSPSANHHQQQQGATTTTASAKVNTRAESETHVVTEMLGKMHVEGEDAEAKRKATKLAAKEAKQNEKAKAKAEQDAKIESMMKLLQELHRSRDNKSMSQADAKVLGEKIDIIQEKIGKLHEKTDTLHKKTDKLHDVSHEIKTTQVHSKQRRVPRIVLCTERGVNMKQKLLTKLPIGIRAVQLHLLCEQPGKEHIVADATGCEINQMIGERWNKLQPLLATGLQLVSMAVNVGGAMTGLGQIFPNLGRNVWDIKAVDLGKHSVQGRKTQGEQAVAEALRVSQEEESAAQWLVSYLEENEVAIHEAFGLVRVRYTCNNPSAYCNGSLAWLCNDHQREGLQAGILESFPVRR